MFTLSVVHSRTLKKEACILTAGWANNTDAKWPILKQNMALIMFTASISISIYPCVYITAVSNDSVFLFSYLIPEASSSLLLDGSFRRL